ncbi:MAG: prephenate dehydratase [Sumerlaeia bacterium]
MSQSQTPSHLTAFREEIDAIDAELVRLLDRRAEIARAVGEAKEGSGRPTFDPGRGKAVIERALSRSKGDFPKNGLEHVMREVVSACLNLQKPLRVAFLGPAATYAHLAAAREFGTSVTFEPCEQIRQVFEVVSRGEADYGVVPVENSTGGMVHQTLDSFFDFELRICSEVLLPIRHCLLSNVDLDKIEHIYSHPQTFQQCAKWLREHLPSAELHEMASTVKGMIKARRGKNSASIGSALAAEEVGLKIVAEGIEDNRNNTTRFLVIAKNDTPACGDDKTSLMFCVKNKPGALFHLLKPFADRDINLTKIESRPSKKEAWEYVFFVDLIGHRTSEPVRDAVAELEAQCLMLRILGSYPRERSLRE